MLFCLSKLQRYIFWWKISWRCSH